MAGYYHTGLAKGAFFSGVLSLLLGPITAIPSIFMGHIARSRAKHFPHQYGGSGMALTGLFLSYLSLFVFVLLTITIYSLQTNGQLESVLNMIDSSGFLSDVAKSIFAEPDTVSAR